MLAFVYFTAGITAKEAGKATDHDDTLDLLTPGPAKIHMFKDSKSEAFCSKATLQKKTSFDTDLCYNIDPLFIKEFMFIAPPVCKNGTVAKYTAFQESNCWGEEWHSWQVTDMHLDQCLRTTADKERLRSFGLVCDGVKRRNSKLRLVFTLLLLFGLSLAVLGLTFACVRVGLLLVSRGFGSLTEGLKRSLIVAKVSLWSLFASYDRSDIVIGVRLVIYIWRSREGEEQLRFEGRKH